ncbi:uncharacterized protein LOC129756532 [Uranotaenia lowii]|uniref:uncharacterized protein LOC129756532 n=1 Tax=Uranotaenia lowii TaxID=190385 RepID=UPI002478B8DA|nr:uncharacterized protein LOC129756532 [Uranotaenia lowii]
MRRARWETRGPVQNQCVSATAAALTYIGTDNHKRPSENFSDARDFNPPSEFKEHWKDSMGHHDIGSKTARWFQVNAYIDIVAAIHLKDILDSALVCSDLLKRFHFVSERMFGVVCRSLALWPQF